MALALGNGTHGNMQLGIWQLGSLALGDWHLARSLMASWQYWHIIESGRILTSLALDGHWLGSEKTLKFHFWKSATVFLMRSVPLSAVQRTKKKAHANPSSEAGDN